MHAHTQPGGMNNNIKENSVTSWLLRGCEWGGLLCESGRRVDTRRRIAMQVPRMRLTQLLVQLMWTEVELLKYRA